MKLKRRIIGRRFGKLVIIEFDHKDKHNLQMYLCRCDCGETKVVRLMSLKCGDTTSCGCKQKDVARLTMTGNSYRAKEYKRHRPTVISYNSMMARCYKSNQLCFKNHGGRGITVCDRWKDSFANFLEDMGERPEGLELDREDNDGNYEPGNCRWSTRLVNNRNRSCSTHLTLNGITHTISEWSDITNLPYQTIYSRIRYGWSVSDILNKPQRKW